MDFQKFIYEFQVFTDLLRIFDFKKLINCIFFDYFLYIWFILISISLQYN